MVMKHPFVEIAEIWEEKLREQRWHDKRNDGVSLFASELEESELREAAQENRRLARIDIEQGGWPNTD